MWELVIRIAYTKVKLLSFMRNIFIYSLYFTERHTPTVCRYCTKVYTVKAERAKSDPTYDPHIIHTGTQHQRSLQLDVVY